jgi:hypothetical protein
MNSTPWFTNIVPLYILLIQSEGIAHEAERQQGTAILGQLLGGCAVLARQQGALVERAR